MLEIKLLEKNIENIVKYYSYFENDPISLKNYERMYDKFLVKHFLEKEIMIIAYYKLLLSLNKYKFEDKFIIKIKAFY